MHTQMIMMEFRTPQHPSLGTNNWGGASPLLARDIPKESLEQSYLRLNTVRTRDEIFPAYAADYFMSCEDGALSQSFDIECNIKPPVSPAVDSPGSASRKGFLLRFIMRLRRGKKQMASASLGGRKKRRFHFRRMDPKTRWPNGWC